MGTGSRTDDGTTVGHRSSTTRPLVERVLEAPVEEPGRTAVKVLVAASYLWLLAFMATTAFGFGVDPIPGNDWLTLLFTSYALFSSVGLARRLYQVGVDELTDEYLLDVVTLTWLTAFYFVWMLARAPVSESTSVVELYGPLVAGQPGAILWALLAGVVAVVTAGVIYSPSEGTVLFGTPFRTALVTGPGLLTATVLLTQPGPNSLVWALVGGVFVGTLAGGSTYTPTIVSSIATAVFTGLSLVVWSVGALGWLLVRRTRPPSDHPLLERVGVGDGPSDDPTEDETRRTGAAGVTETHE